MGKTLRRVCILFLAIKLLVPASGLASDTDEITVEIGSTTASRSGKPIKLKTPIEIRSGSSFVALYDIGKLIDGRHTWNAKDFSGSCYDSLTNTTIIYKLENSVSTVDGDPVILKAKPYISKKIGAFMIPLRATLAEFGYALKSAGKKITITRKNVLDSIPWHGPGIDGAKTSSVPNGHAPKSGKYKVVTGMGKGNEELYPLIYGDKLLFGNEYMDKAWVCYDTDKFGKVWVANQKHVWYRHLMSQFGYDDGCVFSGNGPTCIDAQTGEVLWQKDITIGDCYAADGKVIAFKVVEDDHLVKSVDLCCFDAVTGRLMFMTPIEGLGFMPFLRSFRFAFSKDRLFFYGLCIELSSGKVLFEVEKDNYRLMKPVLSTPNGSFLYYYKEFLRLIDGSNGKLIHEWNPKGVVGYAYQNGKLYVSSGKTLKRIDEKTGLIEASESALVGNVTVSGHLVYVNDTQKLYAYGTNSLKEIFNMGFDNGYNKMTLVHFDRGAMYSIHMSSFMQSWVKKSLPANP